MAHARHAVLGLLLKVIGMNPPRITALRIAEKRPVKLRLVDVCCGAGRRPKRHTRTKGPTWRVRQCGGRARRDRDPPRRIAGWPAVRHMVFAGHLFRSEIVEAKIINRKLFPVEKAPFETSHKTGGRDLRIHKDLRLTARTPFGAIDPLAGQAPACASARDKRRTCQKTTPQAPIMENYFLLLPAKQSVRIYDSACIENRKDCLFPHCGYNDYSLLEKHRLCDNTSRYAGQLYSRAVDQGVTPDSCCPHPDDSRRQAERSVFFSRAEWKHAQGIRDRTPLRAPPVSCISFLRQPQYRIDIHRVL